MTNEEFNKLPENEQDEIRERIKNEVLKEVEGLTSKQISKKFDEMTGKFTDATETAEDYIRYGVFWELRSKDDPKGHWSRRDQIKYPRFGWAPGEWFDSISAVGHALNRLKDVTANLGTIYGGRAYHGGKILWRVKFANIAAYQHFIWAGCHRYFPLNHNEDWLLTVDDGDPHYGKTDSIDMILQYQDTKAKRKKWEEDLKVYADGINKYADEEEKIAKELGGK